MKKLIIMTVVAMMIALIAAMPALGHQHLQNPSGFCPDDNASVPQGVANPAGNMPGDRNGANNSSGFQGVQSCLLDR